MLSLGFFVIVVFVRAVVTESLGRVTDAWTAGERVVIAAMFPRGVATAVMAFLPIASGIPETELFPIYALTVIVFGVVGMAVILALYQRRTPSSPTEPPANLAPS